MKEQIWGSLIHLGSNMWDDFLQAPDEWAKSAEEEKIRPNPVGPSGRRRSSYRCYLQCRDDLWKKAIDHMAAKKMNTVFIDLGEGRTGSERRRNADIFRKNDLGRPLLSFPFFIAIFR